MSAQPQCWVAVRRRDQAIIAAAWNPLDLQLHPDTDWDYAEPIPWIRPNPGHEDEGEPPPGGWDGES